MKKVLALVVAFALCFTAFAGCFATSAATLDNFAVSSVEVAADAQAAAVTVSGTYTGKAVQLLTVTLPEGVALASVAGANELTDTQDGDYIVTGNSVKFLTVPNDAFTYTLNVTFAANASETDVVTHTVVANVEYALYNAETPVIEYAEAEGTITVATKAPAHVHAAAETKEENRVEPQIGVPGSYEEVVYCSCGEVISRTTKEIPALEPEEPECEHEETITSIENVTVATSTAAGSYDTVVRCANDACNEVISTTTTTVPATSNMALGRNILAEKTLGLRLMVQKTQLDAYGNDFYIDFRPQHYKTRNGVVLALGTDPVKFTYVADNATVPEGYVKQSSLSNNIYNFDYLGFTACEMTLDMTVTIYCIKDGVVVAESQVWEFSLADRIENTLKGNAGATTKTLYMDMANYGEAAQIYFSKINSSSDLAKNTLYPTANLGNYKDLATDNSVASSALASKEGFGGTSNNGYNTAVGKGLVIEENNKPRFLVNPRNYDLSLLTLKVCYTDSINGNKDIEVNVSELPKDSDGYPYYVYGEVALYDASSVVTAELYIYDETAQQNVLTYTRTYSVEAFIAEMYEKNKTDEIALGNALLKFAHSCRVVMVK